MNRAGMPYSKFQGKYADLSEKILEVFFKVYQELGYGFNENYLKATDFEVGYVLNFGPTYSFKRKIYDNERKGPLTWVRK